MEAEYQATIAAMRKRIEELEGTEKQLVGARNAQKLPMFFRLILMKFILMSRTLREE